MDQQQNPPVKIEKRWDEVKDIGDYALFFDSHKAVYVSVKDHPECQRNCVYQEMKIYRLGFCLLLCDSQIKIYGDDWILPSNY
ncbi:unnamed protein product [Linum trigynum]|uniref:KIB1-4 beta-propeller domain-containing protein n=1 Tax=Linum trigynum TaxID=586398 RepID=A0AAV2C8D9_9ROSI